MEWTAIAGGILSVINVVHVLISWKSRGDVAELKLLVAEKLTKTERDVRTWAENEFARKETVQAQLEALKTAR